MIKINKLTFLFFTIFILLLSKIIFALETIVIDDRLTEISIAKHVEYLEDKSGKLTIDDIAKENNQWTVNKKDRFNFGYTRSNYWFKLRIYDKRIIRNKIYLEIDSNWLAYIDLFIPGNIGKFYNKKSGVLLPFSIHEVDYKNPIFSLDQSKKHDTFYLKINTHGPFEFKIKLLTPDTLHNRIVTEYPIQGIYFGFMLVMIFYNLFIYMSVKDRSYIYYVIFIVGYMFTQLIMSGLANQFLWSQNQFWNELIMFMCIAIFGVLMFFKYYVQIEKNNYIIDKIISILALLNFISIFTIILLFKFFDWTSTINMLNIQLMVLLNFLSTFAVLISSIILSYKGNRQARFFLISFMFVMIGSIIRELQVFDIIPLNAFTKYSLQVGSAFTVVLLSLGLADKIKILKDDLEILNNNLEQKVEERTAELEKSNEKLHEIDKLKNNFFANISHEIRTPLTLILSPVESIIQDDYKKEVGQDFFLNIQRNGIRLLRLVNNLLDYSKIQEGKMAMKVKEIDIVKIVENYIITIKAAAESKGVDVIFNSSMDSLKLFLDIEKTNKIGMNLFSNAIKFTDNGV